MNSRLNLVQRARAGDAAAVAELIEQSRPAVFRLALAVLDDRRQAADATQAAAYAVADDLADYSGAPAYFIWLYQIVLQICRARLRRQRLWQRLPDRLRAPFSQIRVPPEPKAAFTERQELIVRMVNRLEEKLRLTVVLRYDQELQVNEIGPVLNWRELSVQTCLTEARELLCNALLEVPRGVEAAEIDEAFTHREAQALIQAAADGLMKQDETRRLKVHLETCVECQAFEANWQALEVEIRAAMHARWDQQALPGAGTSGFLLHLPNWLSPAIALRAGGAAIVVIFAAALLQSLSANRPVLPPPPAAAPPPAPTSRPTFSLVENRPDLLSEIYPGKLLMNTGGDRSANILVIEPKSGVQRSLTQNPLLNTFPTWSPDGQRIAYLSQNDPGDNQIMLMNSDGSGKTTLLPDPVRRTLSTPEPSWYLTPRFGPPHWSPDGQRLAAGVQTGSSGRVLAIIPAARSDAFISIPVAGLDTQLVEWSPDGRMLAYACHDNREVWVWEPDSKIAPDNTRRIEKYITWDMTLGLAWSPDSARLAILTGDLKGSNVTVNLRIYRASGVLERDVLVYIGQVANPFSRSRRLAWSPDGRYLAFTGITNGTIQLIQANGSGLRTLAEFEQELGGVAWSPDGHWLAFPLGTEIWAVSLDALEVGEHAMLRLPVQLAEQAGPEISWQTIDVNK